MRDPEMIYLLFVRYSEDFDHLYEIKSQIYADNLPLSADQREQLIRIEGALRAIFSS